MIILGIETSCDETAAAVLEQSDKGIQILSNIVSSSAPLQVKYGGILPEQAAREQVKMIIPIIEECLQASGNRPQDIDAIAVAYGPGLIGSLLVGVETAKTLAKVWDKPLIPVNHLLAHFYANWIGNPPSFPAIGLLVSGGHTDLIYFKNHNNFEHLGGTRDDAAGECFDKCARLLGFPYPGGPQISKLAEKGNPQSFNLPRPMIDSKNFDFSFSGLKTAFSNIVSKEIAKEQFPDLSASLEQAIVDILVTKLTQAVNKYQAKQVLIAGGVAANQTLRKELKKALPETIIHIPDPELCTDNGAMIAARAFFESPIKNPLDLQANPSLSY